MSRYVLFISGIKKFRFNSIQTVRCFVSQYDSNGELSVEVYDSSNKVYVNLWTGKVIKEEDIDWEKEGF